MPVWNRPHELTLTLDSLGRNGAFGIDRISFACEPCDDARDAQYIQDTLKHRSKQFPRVNIHMNHSRLGIEQNIFVAVEREFTTGSEVVFVLEDDIQLAWDALDLVRWFAKHGASNPHIAALTLSNYFSFSHNRALPWHDLPADPERVFMGPSGLLPHFLSHGWACGRQAWEAILKPNWSRDSRAWDWSIDGYLLEHPELSILQPQIARAVHAGPKGVHCLPGFHDCVFGRNVLNTSRVQEFRVYPLSLPRTKGILEVLGCDDRVD